MLAQISLSPVGSFATLNPEDREARRCQLTIGEGWPRGRGGPQSDDLQPRGQHRAQVSQPYKQPSSRAPCASRSTKFCQGPGSPPQHHTALHPNRNKSSKTHIHKQMCLIRIQMLTNTKNYQNTELYNKQIFQHGVKKKKKTVCLISQLLSKL